MQNQKNKDDPAKSRAFFDLHTKGVIAGDGRGQPRRAGGTSGIRFHVVKGKKP
jgi:hypothetical protein